MFRKMKISTAILLSAVGGMMSAPAAADAYPTRAIKVIVPYPAGGGTDVLIRTVTNEMAKSLGQTFVVINRPGAGGMIGVSASKMESPDGYTMVVSSTSTMAVYPAFESKLSYQPMKDFVHAGMVAKTPGVLVATKSLPADNLKDLNKLLKADPDKYVIGSGTPTTFMTTELYKLALKANIQTINYNGSPPVLLDLIPGRVHLTFMIAGAALPEIKNGTVKPIAVTWKERLPQLPNVGTMKEAGMGEVDASTWIGLAFPKGVPEPIVKKINTALNQALAKPEIIKRLDELGFFVEGGSPEQHTKIVASDLAFWAKVYKDAGSPKLN